MNRRVCVMVALVMVLSSVLMGVVPGGGSGTRAVRVETQNRATIIVNASGGGDYTRIQWAIDNASKGDTVYVEGGTYYENIVVNKTITLAGSSQEITIIDGNGNGDVVKITANWVNITGFSVTNSKSGPYAGIVVRGIAYCRLENNSCICNNGDGIFIDGSNNVSLYNNTCISNSRMGIDLLTTSNSIISRNKCDLNGRDNIGMTDSNDNIIEHNICNNSIGGPGISICYSNNNYISENLCIFNKDGIFLQASYNIVFHNRCLSNYLEGICIMGLHIRCQQNEILNNIINENKLNGIALFNDSYRNVISNNTINSNLLHGIQIESPAFHNLVYHNNFLFNNNNGTQAYDDGSDNEWDDGSEGNYWSDWTTPDTNEDGIVDNPYNLTGTANAQDRFPLTYPISTQVIFANAGLDVTIDSHQTATFDGSNSWGYPPIINYTWSSEYNSTPILLYGPTPSFIFDIPGTYVVTLAVRNDAGDNDTDQMTVQVRESQPQVDIIPPTANAGPDMTIHQKERVTFNASGSTDNVGIVNYTWTFTYNGANVTLYGISPSFTFDIPGTYRITLNVSDARGNRATDSMTLTVRDSTWPKANAGANIVIDQHEVAMFDASDSTDNVGIVNYTWSFRYRAKEILLFGPTPSFRFDYPGTIKVTLNVTDAEGLWDTDTLTVSVCDVTPPVAEAGDDRTVYQGEKVYFEANDSSDNVEIVKWTWTFFYNDREYVQKGWNVSFIFDIPGKYNVTLTVSDRAGNTDSDNLTVTVLERPPPPVLDSDNDGFNDTYENKSGSDPYDPLSTPLDLDGDGWNNSIEVQAGTDPYRKESVPPDMDGDGITDVLDDDRDGDGSPNWNDAFPDDGERWDEDVEAGGRSLWWILGIVLVLMVAGVVAGAVLVGRRREREDEEIEGDGDESDKDELGRVGKEGGDEEESLDEAGNQ